VISVTASDRLTDLTKYRFTGWEKVQLKKLKELIFSCTLILSVFFETLG